MVVSNYQRVVSIICAIWFGGSTDADANEVYLVPVARGPQRQEPGVGES